MMSGLTVAFVKGCNRPGKTRLAVDTVVHDVVDTLVHDGICFFRGDLIQDIVLVAVLPVTKHDRVPCAHQRQQKLNRLADFCH